MAPNECAVRKLRGLRNRGRLRFRVAFVVPTFAGQELINKTCLLAMIRVRAPAPADRDGHGLAQATQKEPTKQYGASGDVKKTAYRGSGIWQDGGRWVTNSEIVSAYAPTDSRYDPADPDRGSVFVFARLPVVHWTEQNACCAMKAYRYGENCGMRTGLSSAGSFTGGVLSLNSVSWASPTTTQVIG
jgi:hypothetical protein